TPLSLAAQLEGTVDVIRLLCLGGAHIDFRARDGATALHRAVCTRRYAALTALLDLGGSPNYKDRRGLTPLYHTAMVGGDPRCCELLLYNQAKSAPWTRTAGRRSTRPASTGIPSIWNICSSMGLSRGPRTPPGTLRCTSVPSITRKAVPASCSTAGQQRD
ncbi:unnamed protein product, partial [Lepidochelys kempii]